MASTPDHVPLSSHDIRRDQVDHFKAALATMPADYSLNNTEAYEHHPHSLSWYLICVGGMDTSSWSLVKKHKDVHEQTLKRLDQEREKFSALLEQDLVRMEENHAKAATQLKKEFDDKKEELAAQHMKKIEEYHTRLFIRGDEARAQLLRDMKGNLVAKMMEWKDMIVEVIDKDLNEL